MLSGRCTLLLLVGLVLMECCYTTSWLPGYLSRTLPDFRFLRNPARVWNYDPVLILLLCCPYFLLCRTFDIRQKFLGIIFCPLCQDGIDHPQYFTGYHNQRLHLLKWISVSRRVVSMKFFKFLCMCCCRFPPPGTTSI